MKKALIIGVFGLVAFAHAEAPAPVASPEPAAVAYADPEWAQEIFRQWDEGQTRAALRAMKKALKAEKSDPYRWVAMARLRFRQEKYASSLRYAQKALRRDPYYAPAYYWRGRAYEARNKWLESANEYRAALLIDQDYDAARRALGRVQDALEPSRSSGVPAESAVH